MAEGSRDGRRRAAPAGRAAATGAGRAPAGTPALGRDRIVDRALADRNQDPDSPVRQAGPTGAEGLGLRTGDDVRHAKWGEGVILDIIGEGDQAEAVIRFPTRRREATPPELGPAREGLTGSDPGQTGWATGSPASTCHVASVVMALAGSFTSSSTWNRAVSRSGSMATER